MASGLTRGAGASLGLADMRSASSAGFALLLCYLAVLLLRPQEFVPALVEAPLVPGLLGSTIIVWAIAQEKLWTAPQHGFMAGFSLALPGSLLAIGWGGGAWRVWLDFLPTLFLYLIIATAVDSPGRWRAVCAVMAACAGVIAVHGIFQASAEDGLGWTGASLNRGRITYLGRLNDPNDLAMALLIMLPLALHLAWWWSAWWARAAAWTVAALMLWAVWLSQSRGAMLALLSMLLLWTWRWRGPVWALGVIVPAGLVSLNLAPGRLAELSAEEASAAGRVEAWYAGLDMLRAHPIWGIGKGLFIDHHEMTAHNSLVLAVAEIGLVGAFFWIGLIVASIAVLRRASDRGSWVNADGGDTGTGDSESRDPVEPGTPEGISPVLQVRSMAEALTYSHVALVVCAFFLSRTYVDILFLPLALSAAVHAQACAHPTGITPVLARDLIWTVVWVELSAVAALAVLVRVLLP